MTTHGKRCAFDAIFDKTLAAILPDLLAKALAEYDVKDDPAARRMGSRRYNTGVAEDHHYQHWRIARLCPDRRTFGWRQLGSDDRRGGDQLAHRDRSCNCSFSRAPVDCHFDQRVPRPAAGRCRTDSIPCALSFRAVRLSRITLYSRGDGGRTDHPRYSHHHRSGPSRQRTSLGALR